MRKSKHPRAKNDQTSPKSNQQIEKNCKILEVSETFPTHQIAFDCIRTYPNASKQVQTHPILFKNVPKREKLHENFAIGGLTSRTSRYREPLLQHQGDSHHPQARAQAPILHPTLTVVQVKFGNAIPSVTKVNEKIKIKMKMRNEK